MKKYVNIDEMLRRKDDDLWAYDVYDLEEFLTHFEPMKIIECGECKFSSNANRTCLCSKSGKYMKVNDFCSYAEPKESEGDNK